MFLILILSKIIKNLFRSNTQYFGGYHAGHQTINWLWDILINDFKLEEKKLFLKVCLIIFSYILAKYLGVG